jgi:hypothetical protein
MSLREYRDAFLNYISGPEVKAEIPEAIKSSDDSLFIIFINLHLCPHRNDMNACFDSLKAYIEGLGYNIPPLGEPQKAKICRFLQCFIKIVETA